MYYTCMYAQCMVHIIDNVTEFLFWPWKKWYIIKMNKEIIELFNNGVSHGSEIYTSIGVSVVHL